MKYTIREERTTDYESTEAIVEEAFRGEEFSDQQEHHLVRRIRQSAEFIPELSLVAETEGNLVGHILLSKVQIVGDTEEWESLALAPVSISPAYQKQGIGGALIQEAMKRAKNLGFSSIVLLGHPAYYPKFGFVPASRFGVQSPFRVGDAYFMAVELEKDALSNVRGTVKYPATFDE
ncbi:GNAT family N-acetyltransferase [Chryseomicrobium palamuruense]|uniref:GNAT family N-acetyltransferase n=1 Tax=Chryseomicrobium palamuruense TaxID=682973 RepID=A0ABV8UYI6_9BACL